MNKNQSKAIAAYLNKLSEPQKSTLARVRKIISEILPTATECISYGLPAFKYNGSVIAGFAAAQNHCSYYPFSGSTLGTLKSSLRRYSQTKSALHFSHDKPLSKKIIKLLLLTRITEIKPKQPKSKTIKAGGVEKYIKNCPQEVRAKLQTMRSLIRAVAPDAIETTSYFEMPGYSYEGYAYNGIFVWFSCKGLLVRLHVRPLALVRYKTQLKKYAHTKAIVCFAADQPLPKLLIKKIVKASLKDMVEAGKN